MINYNTAVKKICEKDPRFHPDAYDHLKDALDYTVKGIMEREKAPRHVNGAELAFGFRDYTLKEYGPMSKSLLKEWGVGKTRDIGDMVFNLIEHHVFSREEGDSPSDFDAIYTFKQAFDKPYLPEKK